MELIMFTKMFAILVHVFTGEGAMVRKISEIQTKRVAYWQLINMSDRELKDVGLTRMEIYRKVYGDKIGGTTA
jgi:uncharacterized protein YjiS (DUF1127 family)